MPVERKANPCSQAADGRPSTRERGEVDRQEPPAAMQRSQSSASSPRRDSLPPLPRPESSRHPEDGSAKTGSVEHGEALPRSSSSGAELPPLPSLPPLPAKAATQADASLRMGRGQMAASTSQDKLPPLPASSGCSARGRPKALQWPADSSAEDDSREHLPPGSGASLPFPQQDASALTGAREESFPAMPEARPSTSASALATPRPLQSHGSRIILPPISRQPSGCFSFLWATQSTAEGTSQGGPAPMEWDKPWPSSPMLPSLPQVPSTRAHSHDAVPAESSASQSGESSSSDITPEAGFTGSESPSPSATAVAHSSAEDSAARPHGEMAQDDSSSPSLPDFAGFGEVHQDMDVAEEAEGPGPAPRSPSPSAASLEHAADLLVLAPLQPAVDVSRRALQNNPRRMMLRRSSAWLRRRGRWHTCSVQRPRQAETSSKRRRVPKVQPRRLSKDLLPLLMAASMPAFLGRHRRPGLGRPPQQFLNEWEEAAGSRAVAALQEAQEEAGQQEVDRDLPEQQQLDESASVHTIWVRPSFQRLMPQRHLRDSEATDADGEVDGNLQSAPLPQAVAAGAEEEDLSLPGGSQQEGTSTLLHTSGSSEGGPAASPSHGGRPHQVPSEHKDEANSSSSSSSKDSSEGDPATAALPHPPAPRPSLLQTLLQALRRAFTCSCLTGQREPRGREASAGRLR